MMPMIRTLLRPLHALCIILLSTVAPSANARTEMAAHAPSVSEAGQRFAVPDALLWAVMRAESRGDPTAVSHAGAMGLMQIMPATWAMLTARHDLGSHPFEPRANILAGAAYLRAMLDRYGDLRLALAAYNAGPGRVDAYLATGKPLPLETRTYVARVTGTGAMAVTSTAPVVTPDWREGALFAMRPSASRAPSGDLATANVANAPERSDRSEAMAPSHDPASVKPSLFVPLARRPGP